MLDDDAYAELDARLEPVDAQLRRRYPGDPRTRQPVHTLYVPADLFGRGVLREYSRIVLSMIKEHGPLPFDEEVTERVLAKLAREPVEDLRIDFEDGYGVRDDDEEDAARPGGRDRGGRTGSGPPSSGCAASRWRRRPAAGRCAPSTCSSTRSARHRPASSSPCRR